MMSISETRFAGGSFKLEDQWVWCGSPVTDGERIHLYASAWSKEYPMFEGYIMHSRIVHAAAEKIDGSYKLISDVFPAEESGLQMAHNPAVRRWKDKWYMFFIGTPETKECDVNNKDHINAAYSKIAIYLAESSSPAGPWKMFKKPILEADKNGWDSSIVTNPAPVILEDGRVYLYYRSNTPEGLRIGLATAESVTGEYRRYGDKPVLSGADVEDPFVWHDGKVFRMVAKDMTGNLTGELHSGAKFSSADGIIWQSEGKAYSRSVVDAQGNITCYGSLERPQMLFDDNGEPKYLFAAVADGPGGFKKAKNTWNICLEIK
ncbi:MAG: glycoside hydrolase family protein [Lentisphaeria bacterium]|nr:glycoside hydrolase family protein [Lentisphaeria bacterium]